MRTLVERREKEQADSPPATARENDHEGEGSRLASDASEGPAALGCKSAQ